VAAPCALRAITGLSSLYSGPCVIAALAAVMILMTAVRDYFSAESFARRAVAGETVLLDTASGPRQRLGAVPSQESFSLPTLQTSTCNCVNHQPLQHLNREESSAKAPATTVESVLLGLSSCWTAAAGGDKPFSRRRVLMRLSHGPP
jgi:hypothetical protein